MGLMLAMLCLIALSMVAYMLTIMKLCTKSTRILTKPTEIHSFLNSFHTISSALQARAIPNERLRKAFNLSNTFVSDDSHVHHAFVSEAKNLLRTFSKAHDNWRSFLAVADQSVQASLITKERDVDIPFDRVVQVTTLRTVIILLLCGTDCPDSFSPDDVEVVCRHITTIWIQSKAWEGSYTDDTDDKGTAMPPSQPLLDELNHHLRRLVPDENRFPNPLNFVIPVWETLWRVVIACVVRVLEDEVLLRVMADLHQNPGEERYHLVGSNKISPKSIVLETLRLHPPVRHIRRELRNSDGLNTLLKKLLRIPSFMTRKLRLGYEPAELVVVDVESALRDEATWGRHRDHFNPARFFVGEEEESLENKVHLAFGGGPLRCVAASWSQRAAAYLTAALCHELDGTNYRLVKGSQMGRRTGWDGWVVKKT